MNFYELPTSLSLRCRSQQVSIETMLSDPLNVLKTSDISNLQMRCLSRSFQISVSLVSDICPAQMRFLFFRSHKAVTFFA